MLRSRAFFAPANLGSRVVGPVEFVIGACRALVPGESMPSTLLLADWTARLGQELFEPPNVGGWPGGRAWLTPGRWSAGPTSPRPWSKATPSACRRRSTPARSPPSKGSDEVGGRRPAGAGALARDLVAAICGSADRRNARGRPQVPGDSARLARGPDRLMSHSHFHIGERPKSTP